MNPIHIPLERQITSSTHTGSTMEYSTGGSENGESSTAGSNWNSDINQNDRPTDEGNDTLLKTSYQRGSHKSHRSRNSGAFLLSGSTFLPPPEPTSVPGQNRASQLLQDQQGKKGLSTQERRHTKKRADIGLGIAESPVATNVSNTGTKHAPTGYAARENEAKPKVSQEKSLSGLDVDSTQIVNLALNLSESRRNAARRNVSTPLPPLANTFGDGFAGGSLRQHLQQQRRIPRNVSPKPQRASTATPRIAPGQLSSPLHSNFDPRPNEYQYQFSASTLARAEKARTQIELMAQYRRLLQYVPPLRPEVNATHGTPKKSQVEDQKANLGREYNPLQYIRNRKIRARERKAIDGEAQGFADLAKVVKWVDQVSEGACSGASQGDNCKGMPVFPQTAEQATSPSASSPKPLHGKSPTVLAKVKRPRVDWDTNPADMLADLFWLEQDDNKKIVEDPTGRRVFPQDVDLQRPMSRKSEKADEQKPPDVKKAMSPNLRIDTKFPEFRSVKASTEKHDSTTDRVRHKIRDATRIHHNGTRESRQFLHARSKSDSDSSETDTANHSAYRRNGSAEAHDRAVDILNKQMRELLAKEAGEIGWRARDREVQPSIRSLESETSATRDGSHKNRDSLDNHSTSGSVVAIKDIRSKRDSVISSGRQSLEVPGRSGRQSLDFLEPGVQGSPRLRATDVASLPSRMSVDLTTPERHVSPSRNSLAKVRSRINPFEHIRTHSRGRAATDVAAILNASEHTLENIDAVEQRPRSTSPLKKNVSRPSADGGKSSRRGSFRRGKTSEDSSGIRGLFKGRRGPVLATSELLGKKDSRESGGPSGFSTDDSDLDRGIDRGSRDSSVDPIKGRSGSPRAKEKPKYDLPTFVSQRDRFAGSRSGSISNGRGERNRSQGQLLNTPRIDIHRASPGSSPDVVAEDVRSDSSVSDIGSRRSSRGVHGADSRLQEIPGIRGRRGSQWTGMPLPTGDSGAKRPSMEGKRQWSISDRDVSTHQGPMNKREIARVRALLLSSGVKAKEISRRAGETQFLHLTTEPAYKGIADLAPDRVKPMAKHQMHIVAAKILSDDVELSKRVWQDSADTFCNSTIQDLVYRLEQLKGTIQESLTPMARMAADEADEVSKDLVTSQTLNVKRITDVMDTMLRRRRRKFRWLRRAGWVLVEWSLVGVMWFAWLIVVFLKIFTSIGRALAATTRWLLWM